jgi:hypothetical protein
MHFSDIIQINELRVFLTENTISLSWVREKESTHLAGGKCLLDVRYFAPIISPTQWTDQPGSHNQV